MRQRMTHNCNKSPKNSPQLIVEQFESKFETNGIKLSVHGIDKDTHIEYVCTDAIAYFNIWIQTRHEQDSSIKSLMLYHP